MLHRAGGRWAEGGKGVCIRERGCLEGGMVEGPASTAGMLRREGVSHIRGLCTWWGSGSWRSMRVFRHAAVCINRVCASLPLPSPALACRALLL